MNLTKNILEYHFLHENVISHSLKDTVYLKLSKLKKKIKDTLYKAKWLQLFTLIYFDKARQYAGIWDRSVVGEGA